MPVNITSVKNEHIKSVMRLRDRRGRDATHLTIVEGAREIKRAIESQGSFKEFYICERFLTDSDKEILERIHSLGVDIYPTSADVFEKIAYGDRVDGLLGLYQPKKYFLKDIEEKKNIFLFIVEAVEKPGNLGAVLRSCDAVGVDGVIVCDEKTDIFNPNVIRASIGAIFTNKIIVSSSQDVYLYLQKRKITTYAATPQAQKLYTSIDGRKSLAIIVGSEEKGLSGFWLQQAIEKIKIPMKGQADSLNVSTSAAVLLYEVFRQRAL